MKFGLWAPATMQALGLRPATLAEMRTYIEQVRALVRGEVTEFTFKGRTRTIGMVQGPGSLDDTFVNLCDSIPVYVAAGGPKALALAGEIADGVILSIKTPGDADVAQIREHLAVGADKVGRNADSIPIFVQMNVYVMEPGEEFGSRAMKESHDLAHGAALVERFGEYVIPHFN
jgi:alkanesulfonate monooxygenase SsuD/methylene tetrahydromethanopterin reductase-like flavin-dependent oxidoreductase (luciferase family)